MVKMRDRVANTVFAIAGVPRSPKCRSRTCAWVTAARAARREREGCPDEMLSSTFHQGLNPVGNSLSGLAKLGDGPVGGVAFGHIVGPGMIDQTLGERRGQH